MTAIKLRTSSWPTPMKSSLFDDFDYMFDHFVKPNTKQVEGFTPACDFIEGEDYFAISLDMPGIDQKDIQIEAKDGALIVSGERKRINSLLEGEVYRNERFYGQFERSFGVLKDLDADKIEAHFDNGVLSIMVPKPERSKAKKIEIQSEKTGFFTKLLGQKKTETPVLKDVVSS